MAEATAKTEQRIEEVVTTRTVEEKVVTLRLSQDEVNALYVVGMNVGGHPDRSPRGHINSITSAIAPHRSVARVIGNGIGMGHYEGHELQKGASAIYFADKGVTA